MARTPLVERIELVPLHDPFSALMREAMALGRLAQHGNPRRGPWTGVDFVITLITADDGSQGVGEAPVWLPETGVSPVQIIDAVQHGLGRHPLGANPFDVERLRARMDANVARSEVANGLLGMACDDLAGEVAQRSACELMVGRSAETLPPASLIPRGDATSMVEMALAFQKGGTQTLRLKLGTRLEADRTVIAQARDALGPAARLRVDYNQANTADEAVRAIEAIAPYGTDCAEQPVRAADWLGMARVQRCVSVPLDGARGLLLAH